MKSTKVFINRYAPDGTVVQILVEETSAKLPKFGIRGMIAKKKKEEAMELVKWEKTETHETPSLSPEPAKRAEA